jgi:hypothetical protein
MMPLVMYLGCSREAGRFKLEFEVLECNLQCSDSFKNKEAAANRAPKRVRMQVEDILSHMNS